MKPNDLRIDYIEFPATNLPAVRAFYEKVFGWEFTDYGPDYTSFVDGRLGGGFYNAPAAGTGTLVVIYAANLEAMLAKVTEAGAVLTKDVFSFPGGRRFQFRDPGGNELAVWSE